jgi:hypothetical protein
MKPTRFQQETHRYVSDYRVLPAYTDGPIVISCWQLSLWERLLLLLRGRLWLIHFKSGSPLQQAIQANDPFEGGLGLPRGMED